MSIFYCMYVVFKIQIQLWMACKYKAVDIYMVFGVAKREITRRCIYTAKLKFVYNVVFIFKYVYTKLYVTILK